MDFQNTETWIPYTEKDSPYYGMDYNKLNTFQRQIHNLYVQGKGGYLNPVIAAELNEHFKNVFRKIKRDYQKKAFNSEKALENIVLNA